MTDPANAASREARAREIAAKVFDARARKASHPEVIALERHHAKRIRAGEGDDYDVVQGVLLALADEAASQPREGVLPITDWMRRNADRRNATAFINTDPAYFASEMADAVTAALHDTAPTDQAQGGCTPEPAPQDNAEIVERCAAVADRYAQHMHGPAYFASRDIAAAIRALATPVQGEI